jgi:Carboxypeptidase regulatory-like domain/TonB-dependent Receptor Plug Domain
MGVSLRAVATAVFAIASCLIPATTKAQAVIRGTLYDDVTGLPLQGTVMLVDPNTDAAVVHTPTDSLGNFQLKTKTGLYRIAAVRAGYKSVLSAPVPLENGEKLTIRVPIAIDRDPQHQIGVTEHIRPGSENGEPKPPMMSAADARRKSGIGVHYTRANLEKSGLRTLGQFLMTVPGLSVMDPNSASTMQMRRSAALGDVGMSGACHVGWFVDGHRMDLPGRTDPLTDGLASWDLESVESVEVFRGLSEMPAEFAAPDLRCGAISIWTRRP